MCFIQFNSYSEGSNTPCTSSCNPWNFGLRHLSSLKQKTNKASRGCRKQKPIQKEKQQTFDEPSFQLPGIAASAIFIMFQGTSNCLWLLVMLVIPSFSLTLSAQKKFSEPSSKSICAAALSLSLSLSACVQLSTPKSKESQNGTLCHIIDLSVKSPCFHPVFGPAFTPHPLFQWYPRSKGNSVVLFM